MNNPENLSKDRLKEELRKKGVPFSPTKNKDYYVSLYKDNLARRTRIRSEFSSDDEAFKRAPKTPPRDRRFTKVLNVDHYMRQLAPISDSELFNQLKKHKVNAGPITRSTREVYQKKLAKIMAEKATKEGVSNSSSGVTIAASESDNDEFSSDNDEQTDQPSTPRQEPLKQIPQVQRVIHQSSSSSSINIQRSPSYHLRSRPTPKEHRPTHKNITPRPPKKVKPDDTDISTSEFSRPYRASWCSGQVILQFMVLLISFVVGLIVFDYMWNGDSRVVTLALGMIEDYRK